MFTTLTIVVFVLGVAVGSVQGWAAEVVRKPQWAPAPSPGCDSCGWGPIWFVRVPAIPWVVMGGRCPKCNGPLSIMNPLLCVTLGTLFAASMQLSTDVKHWLAWAVFWTLLMLVVRTDWQYMRVPNMFSLPGAIVVYVISVLCGVQSWTSALWGAIVGGGVLFALHLLSGGRMGLGDVKLYLSIGAMLGVVGSIESLIFASCSGSILGLALRGTGLLKKRQYMPFVPHILIGAIITAFIGSTLTHWYVRQFIGIS